jgi:spore coat protein U-like protein
MNAIRAFRYAALCLLLLAGWLAMPSAAHADVVCQANIAGSTIPFGQVDPLAGTTMTSAQIDYSCTNYDHQKYDVTLCFNIGYGPAPLSAAQNRQMTGSGGNLEFQLYQGPSTTSPVAGSRNTPGWTPIRANFQISKATNGSGPAVLNNPVPVYVHAIIPPGQSGVSAGSYSADFGSGQLQLTGNLINTSDCGNTYDDGISTLSPFTVTASVLPACTVTATDLDFGTINGFLTGNHDSTSTIQVSCVSGTSYKVGLDDGAHYSAPDRRMQGPGGYISYALYRDSGRSQLWGDASGANAASGTGTGNPQNYTVYGRVPPQTTPSAGTYQDTVTVNVTY